MNTMQPMTVPGINPPKMTENLMMNNKVINQGMQKSKGNTLKIIEVDKGVKKFIEEPMPQYIHKEKPGGKGKALTYVSAYPIIDKLNATFGPLGWSWSIIKEWKEQSEPKIIKTKYQNGSKIILEQKDWIYEEQQATIHVIGRLSVHTERPNGEIFTVSKEAPGSQVVVGGQSEQENFFKSANTDAIKKAATMFGIGLDLYRDQNEEMYFKEITAENPWTDELKEQYKEELDYIENFRLKYRLLEETLEVYIHTFAGGQYKRRDRIPPEFIKDFVQYLKNIEMNSGNTTEGA